MNEKLLNDEVNFMITNASKKELFDYIVGLKIQSKKYKEVIDKAVEKIESWYFALDYAERDRLKIIVEILKEVE